MRKSIFLPVFLLLFFCGLTAGSLAGERKPKSSSAGLDLEGMDPSVAPGNDFFAYANGSWLKNTPIPADLESYGVDELVLERTGRKTEALVEEAAAEKARPGTESQQIGDYFKAYLDTAAIEARGLQPLQPTMERIAGISGLRPLSEFFGSQVRADVDALNATDWYTDNLFGLWVAQDLDRPGRNVPYLLQGGLGMPDREYYLDASPRMEEIRKQYAAHIAAVLERAGIAGADEKARRILLLETRMAKAHADRAATGDIRRGNQHWMRPEFESRAPGLDWEAFFSRCGLAGQSEFVVWQPEAVAGLSALVSSEPIESWKDYLLFRTLEHFATVLPRKFDEENFAFYGRILSGIPQQRDRRIRAVDAAASALGDAVGRRYVRRHFRSSEKKRAETMVQYMITAFAARIDRLSWMTPSTRARAKAKLKTLVVGIGYPKRWTDYSGLRILPGDAFGNLERVELFELKRSLQKLNRPADRFEWVMTPQTVNAVNLPAMNALNFPAAILQPPFFDPDRPAAADFGSIGAIIGHEISHSFDDQGSLFDHQGRLCDWWTDADAAQFKSSAERLVGQYDRYRPFPDAAVNGRLTLTENIADVAGLSVAYDGYRLSRKGRKDPVKDGLTGDQQFFLSFAQSWRQKVREDALRLQLATDGHSPAEYRAAAVRNIDAWYEAFEVKPGEGLYLAPADRVRIW